MDKLKVKRVAGIIDKIEKLKQQMSKDRDLLREYLDDLEGIVSSWDQGLESLEVGISELSAAVDTLSEQV